MSSMKNIKQRMANVRTTQQVIRAMNMVASTRLHRARPRLDGIRPMLREMQRTVYSLSSVPESANHVFIYPREVKKAAYVVITSNRGLCGGYNFNVSEKALAHMEAQGSEALVVGVGAKGCDFFRRWGKHVPYRLTDFSEVQIYQTAGRLGELASSLYLSGEVDEVYVAYTYFASTLSHQPRLERVLPLPIWEGGEVRPENSMKYEPDVSTFIDHLVPLYLHIHFFAALCESVTCEHAARMMNMDSAGRNATEVIDELRRMYNRKRQAGITQELSEIVGGANILE